MKCMERFRLPWKHCDSGIFAADAGDLPSRFRFDLQRFADGDKTEEPTAKKRSDAAKKGQVGKSQELSTAFVLLIGFAVIKALWKQIYTNIAGYTIYIFGHLNQTVDVENVLTLFGGIMVIIARTAFPIMLAVMAIGLAVNLAQTGLIFSTDKLEPKLENLNPINGVGRLFSKRSLIELVKSLLKIGIIGFFIYNNLKDEIFTMPQFIFYDLYLFTKIVFFLILVHLVLDFVIYHLFKSQKFNFGMKMRKNFLKT